MILVCAADDFQKILENAKNEIFIRNLKISVKSKKSNVLCFFKSTNDLGCFPF